MNNIVFITNKYPNPVEPNALVFLQQLIWEIAETGIDCSVICPVPININPKYLKFPYETYEKTDNGTIIKLYFPKYIGYGQSDILGINPAGLTTNNFTRAVNKVIKKMSHKPEALYGHFVTPAGIAAARAGRKFNIPSFLAYGEATTNMISHFGFEKASRELSTLSGIISVSTHNKNVLLSVGIGDEKKIGVFPNGYREERFYPRNKNVARDKFNLPYDKFIAAFVGSFDHRKGIKRFIEAVEDTDDVYAICAGKGELYPSSDRCLYTGPVNNEYLPYFYSAADIFVLPTLNEGCCNAIIEAMACGLPIISSDLPFNDDILDNSNSIKINPTSTNGIKRAIEIQKNNNSYLNCLIAGSLQTASVLMLKDRALRLIEFMTKRIEITNSKKD